MSTITALLALQQRGDSNGKAVELGASIADEAAQQAPAATGPIGRCTKASGAAGKGGAIRRLAKGLDPRSYEVVPVAAPNKLELSHHYLWRFWNAFPKGGHFAIFDRTWYGRVTVERLEGFCSEAEWKRAYDEINEIEEHWSNHGTIVLKFWMHISKEEQLKRFQAREVTPHKEWKITEEDLRNREKWDAYKVAVEDMIDLTNKQNAPWVIVEGNNKHYARLKVLETTVKALESVL